MSRNRVVPLATITVLFLVATPFLFAQVSVTAANPSSTAPGTVNLNVTISGSGFKKGAKSQFFKTGTTDPGDVVVNSTTFSSASQVVANISVSSTAIDASYDVQVMNANGSSGKGTELFGVQSTSNAPINPNVTSIIHNTWNAVTPVCAVPPCQTSLRSDSVTSESASYTDSGRINSSVTDLEWFLDLSSQSTRMVWLTLSQPIDNTQPISPAPDGFYPAFVFSKCFTGYNGTEVSWLTIRPGTSNNICSLRAQFTSGSQTYYLIMSPVSNFAGSGWASVTCNSGDSTGTCNNWTAVPNLTAGGGNYPLVANLYRVNKAGMTLVGRYYNAFHIDVTRP